MSRSNPLDDVEQLIEDFQASGMRELHLRCEQFELYLSSDPDAGPPQVAYEPPAAVATAAEPSPTVRAASPIPAERLSQQQWPTDAVVVRAPYLGTFYRAPKPGAAPYVQIGDAVLAGSDLCLIEVMKLFTAVRAEANGRVHAILAADGELVEPNQPLFLLTPA
jgi:acetyl-CoA carboxylase biotin carboxyl carrier protein